MNGDLTETENVFVQDGTEMRFKIDDTEAVIKACSSDKKHGVLQELYVDGRFIEENVAT